MVISTAFQNPSKTSLLSGDNDNPVSLENTSMIIKSILLLFEVKDMKVLLLQFTISIDAHLRVGRRIKWRQDLVNLDTC